MFYLCPRKDTLNRHVDGFRSGGRCHIVMVDRSTSQRPAAISGQLWFVLLYICFRIDYPMDITDHGCTREAGHMPPLLFEWGGTQSCLSPHFFTRKYFYCWSISFAWEKSSKNTTAKCEMRKIGRNSYWLTISALKRFAPNSPSTTGSAPWFPLPPPVIWVAQWLGGSVVRALARDRKVASSTPGQSATE